MPDHVEPAAGPALEMRRVSKRFGPVRALAEVDLAVAAGTVHALVGENGAGKSTLVKILAGIERPDEGEMLLGGRTYGPRSPAEAQAAGVAMIHQELSLAPDLTVAENVFLGIEPRGRLGFTVDAKTMTARTRELAAEHGFAIDPALRVSELPTASCQVVEILKALARRATVVALDEPTSSLGREEAAALHDAVAKLRASGKAVVYISHRLEEVLGLADEITVLRDGRAVCSGPAKALDVPALVRHMVGREIRDYFPPRQARTGEVRLKVEGLASDEGVEDISFEVRRGEVVGMAGLVGAGRTAVARALAGLARRTAGTVTLDGRALPLRAPGEAIRAGVAYVTEDRKRTGLCLDLPAAWNVTLPCLERIGMRTFLRPGRELAIAAEVGQRLGIRWAGPSAATSSLSGGNQQKLLLGRAVLSEAEVLVLDEPTRGVDIGAKVDIYRLLADLAGSGKCVILVSSELPELLGVTDRILVMRRGRIVGGLRTAEADQEALMRLAAVGEG
jgi:ABC-type sugar transport system ATPase subunit